ncbi:MAG: helix-turn-helix transcriptional regulator [Gammaproteobacteria bacterium]|nr:helix-turn-helix transcriptional regulator [Gammaproteobacteria bacterium]
MLLIGFSLGLLAILFVVIARDFHQITVARVFLALLVATAAFLVNGIVVTEWRWLTASLTAALPALFWLLCQFAFARRPEVKSIWGLLALYTFAAPIIGRLIGASEIGGLVYLWSKQFPVYIEYVVMGHGIWVVIANWQDDLVTSRRKLRGAFLGVVGFSLLWASGTLNFGYGARHWLPTLVSIATLIVAALLLKGRTGVLLGVTSVSEFSNKVSEQPDVDGALSPQSKNGAYDKNQHRLKEVMEKGFFRTEKLTLRKLAQEIELPEYKTRTLINRTLGYRNFNDYINQLRIAEASQRLIDEPDTPVLNIALDVGYRTLSSFNRAFKEIQGVSPTEYRIKISDNKATGNQ